MKSSSGCRNMQGNLFLIDETAREDTPAIPGFSLRRDYVTAEEERELIAQVDQGPWETEWRRRIQQYGLGYAAGHDKHASWIRDFPEWLVPLATRASTDAGFKRFPENSVINEYVAPLGIGPHRDYSTFGPTIACISLGSNIVMDFTHPARGVRAPVYVPARSLWIIAGEARSELRHCIASRLTDVF
jgi:alkylated DNA repair protein alkB family protein 8